MKQKILYVFLFLFAVSLQFDAFAQNKGKKQVSRMTTEQRIDRQTAQVVNALMLDDATTVKFSAIYKNYLTELQTCQRSGRRGLSAKDKDGKTQLTDEQIEQSIQARFDQSRKILDIREKYYKEFKKVLKPRQILKVYSVEKANGLKVKKEIQHRHNKKKNNSKK